MRCGAYKWDTGWEVSVFGVFLVHIFPHSDWIRRDTPNLSVFSPNAGKNGPEKPRIRTFFTQWQVLMSVKRYGVDSLQQWNSSSAIRKKANLKTEVTRKQNTLNFPKKRTFLTPWYAEMFAFRHVWFSCYLCFEICPFGLLSTSCLE